MHNNEAFRRIRYALELDDTTTIAIFAAGNHESSQSDVDKFSKKEIHVNKCAEYTYIFKGEDGLVHGASLISKLQ